MMPPDYKIFINTDELEDLINHPDLVIVDCRFDLKNPEWGYQAYLSSHIPGAHYADLNSDLSSRVSAQSGRHPLPSPRKFGKVLSRLGIVETSQVVAYDDQGGAYAARMWWLLRYFGHQNCALLNGGYTKWQAESRPVQTGVRLESPNKTAAKMAPNPAQAVETKDILENIVQGNYFLLDARTPERFKGLLEPIDTVAGHIPGAINRFHGKNLNSDLTIKDKEILRAEFSQLLENVRPQDVVVYCGSGVTSCLHIAAMEYAGLTGARLYPGSWSEWIRDANRPFVTD